MTGDLAAAMSDVARSLLGEPVAHLSTAREWRYGRRGSLSIDVERGLWHDHEAGIGGGVLDLIRRERGDDAADAWRRSVNDNRSYGDLASARPMDCAGRHVPARELANRVAHALAIWNAAQTPAASPVEAYLACRGLSLGVLGGAPGKCIRFAPACPFGRNVRVPAMLVLLTDIESGKPAGIRRTALTNKGARACDVGGTKLPHKALGRARSAVARLGGLSAPPPELGLCEGVETGLSVMAATGGTVWACPAGTLARVPVLPGVEWLAIYADNDPPGLSAARAVASRWAAVGRQVSIDTPTRPGADFNDLWREKRNG